MFKNKTELDARNEILELVKELKDHLIMRKYYQEI